MVVFELSCRSMTSQMCSIGLRSGALGGQNIKCIHQYAPRTTPTQSEPCDMGRCPAGRFHLQLGRQTPCKGATDPQ
ncbi:hypothetical protein AVEN_134636-1 [Araneus ventricosus]|uniref:Uncharacterized protein n=1 Tax=Araneus ventricosus TaxID=182803 RepID=A0A4Y2K062_ARAVE|nr:hypothetical protein AVEN_191376-1 [Araneus ventricosus]GBM94856.1 hypothetical protein AVEN_134636-1 [Araneus ventricosus]